MPASTSYMPSPVERGYSARKRLDKNIKKYPKGQDFEKLTTEQQLELVEDWAYARRMVYDMDYPSGLTQDQRNFLYKYSQKEELEKLKAKNRAEKGEYVLSEQNSSTTPTSNVLVNRPSREASVSAFFNKMEKDAQDDINEDFSKGGRYYDKDLSKLPKKERDALVEKYRTVRGKEFKKPEGMSDEQLAFLEKEAKQKDLGEKIGDVRPVPTSDLPPPTSFPRGLDLPDRGKIPLMRAENSGNPLSTLGKSAQNRTTEPALKKEREAIDR